MDKERNPFDEPVPLIDFSGAAPTSGFAEGATIEMPTVPDGPLPMPKQKKYGFAAQLKDVHENSFGGYHKDPEEYNGEGVMVDRQALSEEKYARDVAGRAYGGVVKKISAETITDEDGEVQDVFTRRTLLTLSESFAKIGKEEEGAPESYADWRHATIAELVKPAHFKHEDDKPYKEQEIGEKLDALRKSGMLKDEVKAEKLADALDTYRKKEKIVELTREGYKKDHHLLKRYATNTAKFVKDVVAAPGTVANKAHIRLTSRTREADPEKMAKWRGLERIAGALVVAGTVAFMGYRIAKGVGGITGTSASAGHETAMGLGFAGSDDHASSPSPSTSPSAHETTSSLLSHEPKASASASPNPLETEGKAGAQGTKPTDLTTELNPEVPTPHQDGYEADLGKFERDESGKYWKGTLEWKMREAAQAQGLHLSDHEISVATHRYMDEHHITEAKAERLSDGYRVTMTQDQMDNNYFKGLGDHDTQVHADTNIEGKDTHSHQTEPQTPTHDLNEQQKMEGDGTVPIPADTVSAAPTPTVSPSASTAAANLVPGETGSEDSSGAGTAIAYTAGGVATLAGLALAARQLRKRRDSKDRPIDLDDLEFEDETDEEEKLRRGFPEDDDNDDEDEPPRAVPRKPASKK